MHYHKNCSRKQCNRNACTSLLLVLSAFNFILGLTALNNCSLLDHFLEQRITMSSGFPFQILEKWSKPDLKLKVNVYLFAVKNSEEFQNGVDEKLKLKEIGPIVYYQTIQQTDVVFEENSTLSYTTLRSFEFAENENIPQILNQSLIIVNPLMLSMAAKLENLGYAHLLNFLNQYDDIFINRTVYEVLWNSSSILLDKFKSHFILRYFLPTDNLGFLYNAFKVKPERYNVKIGLENGLKNFWKINLMNGNTKIDYYEEGEFDECPFSVVNATDGTGYPPGLTKDSIKIASIRGPRVFDFNFEKEVKKCHLNAYRYVFDNKNLMRMNDSTKDCLGQIENNHLPDGVYDGSKLAYDMPLAISNPHFYGFKGPWNDYIEGLYPNEYHTSYIEIEPITGTQLAGTGAMQSNIPVPIIKYTDKVKKFSGKIIPIFWIEEKFERCDYMKEMHICEMENKEETNRANLL